MRLKNIAIVAGILLCLVSAVSAQTGKTYIILANGQGKGSTDFAASLGNALVANYESIGIVVAQSNTPNFATWVKGLSGVQDAVEDVEVPWIPSNELNALSPAKETVPITVSINQEPFSGYQWALYQIGANATAANGDLGAGVVRARVAVLDSGIVTDHPDIAPNLNLALSRSFVPTEPSLYPPPGFNHGTHVAGIIAAPVNGRGIQGVAPAAEIVAVKVLRASGSGAFSWMIAGLDYASGPQVQADIVNLSLGATFDRINAGGGGAGPLIAALARAVNHAGASGTLVVCAAGNEAVDLNSRLWSIPAQSGTAMAVAATGPIDFIHLGFNAIFDRAASYTNFGQSVITVAAPGGDFAYMAGYPYDMVISPGGYSVKGNKKSFSYYFGAGTSMAAPHVSGLAALLVGRYGHMSPAQLETLIRQSADDILDPGADPYSGAGRINAAKALGIE